MEIWVVDISNNIIGAIFLKQYNLLMDLKINGPVTKLKTISEVRSVGILSVKTLLISDSDSVYDKHLYQYVDITHVSLTLDHTTLFTSSTLHQNHQSLVALHVWQAATRSVKKKFLFGMFKFGQTSFGLRNAAQTFQGFIDEVTSGLNFFLTYVDGCLSYK